MESHIMNVPYHQARYRTIGHKIMRSTSESLSSESSCNQNSPEYPQPQHAEYDRIHDEEEEENEAQDWDQNQAANITQSSQDTSSDEEEEQEQLEVQEVPYENSSDSVYDLQLSEADNSLVEGDDYDVIQVYAVHPDLDLEASSDDDDEEQEDFAIPDKVEATEIDYVHPDDTHYTSQSYDSHRTTDILQDGLNIDLDTPVVSNVDEYFIKVDNKNILEVKDEPVVQDVDEYFIKETKEKPQIPNVDDFFIKHKVPEEESTRFHIEKPQPVVEELFSEEVKKDSKENETDHDQSAEAINESDLEVLPNIEDLKRFLLEDMTYSKLKNAQRSCSVPHSPMNICMDIDDAKTCLSFEDLNLDLSDLAFDNDKDKSDASANKSDDIPRALTEEDVNSFLITSKPKSEPVMEDDFSTQDMEIDRPVESSIDSIQPAFVESPVKQETPEKPIKKNRTSTPIAKPTVLDFCVEKTTVKKEPEVKVEADDFVDVESCNDAVIPVLEANNLNSLLEQFEATEKLNTKSKKPVAKTEEPKLKISSKNSLTNGMRLQDAGVQLNKNKMRHILMPSTLNTAIRRSPSPVHSDHDYCTSKKRHSLPNLKGGQSLLKPEVLSSNSRILNSRHRSCKNKKIVYNLSSDDESEKCNNNNSKNKKLVNNRDDSDAKKTKLSVKQPVKPIAQSTCRKKLSPPHSMLSDGSCKSNNSVMNKSACKASDTPCSQNSNGSIKLTIKNKSEVILNCDDKDSQKDNKHIEKHKNISVSDKTSNSGKSKAVKDNIKEVDSNKCKTVNKESVCTSVSVKEEPRPKDENFYTALFPNKQDVQVPQSMVKSEKKEEEKKEKRPFDEELQRISDITCKKETEQPQKKKKLNLLEYKMRIGVNSNNSSTQVSPEAIFPDIPHLNLDKSLKSVLSIPNGAPRTTGQGKPEAPKTFFDPIREASRKILMNTKKQKAEAMRKRDEDIVMSKIPKVENLQLQPLISDAEMMKIVGMTTEEPVLVAPEKPQALADYEEIILVSVGVNTDERMFKLMEPVIEKRKSQSPPCDAKNLINFKIKKSDHVLKQNVFDSVKREKRSPVDDKKHESRIDKERYKDITAALKSVEKQVDTKISSNSLFASIQDTVMKKAPEDADERESKSKSNSPTEKRHVFRYVKTSIVRDFDMKAEHGEDKIILHLGKGRCKPVASTIEIQTDPDSEFGELSQLPANMTLATELVVTSRKRNDSDMSMSSEGSPVRPIREEKVVAKPKEKMAEKRSQSKEKCSRSKDRYESKYRRRSRSCSRSRRRRRSPSRSRSRSRGRYRRYRRSDSPYKRKRRSRSPYRRRSPTPRRSPSGRRSVNDRRSARRSLTPRRSPSVRREHRRSRSRSRHTDPRKSKSPINKKAKLSPQKPVEKVEKITEKKIMKSMTPPLRKPTVSESSDSSTSSSSSSSSASSTSSEGSGGSRRSCSPYKREEPYRKQPYRSYSSDDRESNTPVEERRIVFVGKLEKDITKVALRSLFSKFGPVMEVRLHSKEDGTRYGFVTYQRARDAWTAVEAAGSFPQYDVGFGGRRAFCRQSYADLDGLEAKYTESAFHGQAALPARRTDDMSFEQMLLEMKKKLSQRKCDKKRHDDKP